MTTNRVILGLLAACLCFLLTNGEAPTCEGRPCRGPVVVYFDQPNCVGNVTYAEAGIRPEYPTCEEGPQISKLYSCDTNYFGTTTFVSGTGDTPCTGTVLSYLRYTTYKCINDPSWENRSYVYLCDSTDALPGPTEVPSPTPGPVYSYNGANPCEAPNVCQGSVAWNTLYDDDSCQHAVQSFPIVPAGYEADVCYTSQSGAGQTNSNVLLYCDNYFHRKYFSSGCSKSGPWNADIAYVLNQCVWSEDYKRYTTYHCRSSSAESPTVAPPTSTCDARRWDQPGCPPCDPTKRTDCCDARRWDQPGCPPCDPTKRTDCQVPTPATVCDARRWDQPGCPPCDPTKRTDCCDARRWDQPGCPPCDPTKRTDCCDARRWDQPGCPPCDPTKRTDCCDARRWDQPGCPACNTTMRTDCCDPRRWDQPGCPACDPTKRTDCTSTPSTPTMGSTAPTAILTPAMDENIGNAGASASAQVTFSATLIGVLLLVGFFSH